MRIRGRSRRISSSFCASAAIKVKTKLPDGWHVSSPCHGPTTRQTYAASQCLAAGRVLSGKYLAATMDLRLPKADRFG